MNEHDREQAERLEAYWTSRQQKGEVAPPEGIDPELASTVRRLEDHLRPPDPQSAFVGELRGRLQAAALEVRPTGRGKVAGRGRLLFLGRRLLSVAAAVALLLATLVLAAGVAAGGLEAPTVERYEPVEQGELAGAIPISITFDRPVIALLAERALRIEPATEGSFSWQGNTMSFTPRTGWVRGTRYSVSLEPSARGFLLLPLKEGVSYQFMTAKDLAVTSVVPGDGATEVALDSTIAVQFNNPVVPLGVSDGGPNPLQFEPSMKGKGRWLTTSLYLFQPEGGLSPGTRFQVTVARGLADTGGSSLAADYRWSFATKAPFVAKVSPEANTRFVSPGTEVSVAFDQPVDRPSAERRFTLKGPDGTSVAGSIAWNGDTLVFRPAAPLGLSTTYIATMAGGVESVHGGGESKEFTWSFATVGLPRVNSSMPAHGQQRHPPYDALELLFSNPMDRDSVEQHLSLTPKPPRQRHRGWQEDDTRLGVWGGLNPSTSYSLTLSAEATDRYGQKLGRQLRVDFTTAPLPPRLAISMPGMVGTFNATGSPSIYVEHVNVTGLDFALHSLDRSTFIGLATDPRSRDIYQPQQRGLVRQWSQKPAAVERDQSGLTSVSLAGGPTAKLPAGFYLLRVGSPERISDSRLLVVSRLGLTMKRSDGQLLVWATDLTSGESVGNLPIRIVDRGGRTLSTGRTDRDGLLLADGVPMVDSARRMMELYVFAEGDGDPGVASSEWMQGIHSYQFGIPWAPFAQPYQGYLHTDRPIYRPGQKVLFKGIVRSDDDAHYTMPPPETEVEITISDGQGRKAHEGRVRLSDMGTFDGELALSSSAALGDYYISARIDNWGFGVNFGVAEYRKPEFEARLAVEGRSFVHGDQIPVTGSAAYYFGQPLANAPVRWRVISSNHIFSLPEGGYQFVDYDLLRDAEAQGERSRTEGRTSTGDRGEFGFHVAADLTRDAVSQRFTIEGTLTDANNQEVSARTEVVVHKSDRYVGLRPERYVARAGESAAVELLLVDREGRPVPGVPATVSFYSRQWLSVKERQPDGSYLWSSKPEDTLLSSMDVSADAAGKAKASALLKQPGMVRVVAEVTDSRGNRARSATYLYVSGSGYASWRMENSERVELVPDRKEYAVGDTARVLIPSPAEDTVALVTVERGKLLSHRLLRLKGNSETVEVPILPGYVPNVYVSAVLFKGSGAGGVPTFRVGYAELKVATEGKKLRVDLKPDKPRYEPGEKATYSIRTTDSSGKGVPAELSVAVVYYSVLALANENARDAMDSFWSRRVLGVSTAATMSLSVDRHNADISRQSKGAGGGGEVPVVRRQFPDTAFWDPRVKTDEKGEATVVVSLPDSLTTWRTTARGVTPATQVGSGSVDLVVAKSLMLRPALPRFLLMGDRFDLAALLHNYTDGEVEAEVTLTARGIVPESGAEFSPLRVKVAPGGLQQLAWPARVGSVPGGGSEATIAISARPLTPGVPGDAVEVTLPVNPLTTAEVVATSGEVRDAATELVRLPRGANPALGELTVETSPSLAAGMRFSARYLDEFPYECTEQTVSRFLPRVVMQRAFDRLGLPDREGIAGKLPGIVERSIQRLYSGQRPDGGWGWWPNDSSDQWITAYAVHGLAEARRSGHTVDEKVLDRAIQFLRRSLDVPSDVEHPENPNGRAYVLYAMALVDRGDPGLTNALYDRRSILGNYGRAYLLLALQALGAGPRDGKVSSLVADLVGSAVASATGAHWEEAQVDHRTMNTDTRSTALVLNALVKVAPENPLIPSAVRWLMVARKEGRWETTQETSASLLALVDYLEASGELKGDFAYRVSLNERELATETVTGATVDEAKRLVVEVRDLLAQADNRVTLARAVPAPGQSGEGKLYYTMHLRYFLPGEKVPATGNGLALMREYYRLDEESAGPVSEVKAGDTVKVKLTVVALQDMHYLVVEDPLPSGLEAVDTRLKTTSLAAQAETGMRSKEEEKQKAEGDKFGRPWWRQDFFNHVEPRDDRVALFASYLPRGSYEYTYLARATTSGEFQALPARGYEMYFPEVGGRSEGGKLRVGG